MRLDSQSWTGCCTAKRGVGGWRRWGAVSYVWNKGKGGEADGLSLATRSDWLGHRGGGGLGSKQNAMKGIVGLALALEQREGEKKKKRTDRGRG